MKMKVLNIMLVGLLALGVQSCFHNVQRIDVEENKDISGKWKDVDSRLTSEEMVTQVLEYDWLKKHMSSQKEKPVVIVGFVTNKSHEHIEAETFMKDIERSFIQSNKVRLVQGGEKREAVDLAESVGGVSFGVVNIQRAQANFPSGFTCLICICNNVTNSEYIFYAFSRSGVTRTR